MALNSVISLAYYAKIIRAMYLTRDPDANASAERTLLREKRSLPAGESTLVATVKDQPGEVAVDPNNLLIDRVPEDNRRRVSLAN